MNWRKAIAVTLILAGVLVLTTGTPARKVVEASEAAQ